MLFLYVLWKVISRDRRMYVPLMEMDLRSGARMLSDDEMDAIPEKTWANLPYRIARGLF